MRTVLFVDDKQAIRNAHYSDRPYRKAYDFRRVIESMHEMTDTHFDPLSMDLFMPISEEVRANG